MSKPFVTIPDVECTRETPKAILCVIRGREVWVPQSQVHDDSEVFEKGGQGKLVVSSWFVEQEDL